MSPRILFFGNERLATGVSTTALALQALIAAGYDVAAVVVAQSDIGKSRSNRGLEIAEVANAHNIPLLAPAKLSEIADQLATFEAQIGILIAFGKMVPQRIIDLFPNGIVNIHPSLLPVHRGPTPLESVILDDDHETGVSLMALAAKMDAGPVYAQQKVALRGNETKQALADQLLNLGTGMLLEHLPGILSGAIQPEIQDGSQATYDQLIKKEDAVLSSTDWNVPTEALIRKLRAYAGWPRLRASIGTTDVIITQAHAGNDSGAAGSLWLEGKQLGIFTSDGVFIIDSLLPSGKKEMSATAFLAGYRPN